jgi:hypothetical protein
LGWETTDDAEFVALTQLQADAFVTSDGETGACGRRSRRDRDDRCAADGLSGGEQPSLVHGVVDSVRLLCDRHSMMTLRAAALSIRAPLAWLGPGKRIEQATVVIGRPTRSCMPASRGERRRRRSTVLLDGVLLPAAADRHVHMGLADRGRCSSAGSTAVRDLAWPSAEIFPLADASGGVLVQRPLVRAGRADA